MSFTKIIEKYFGEAVEAASSAYTSVSSYADTAFEKVEGFLGMDDGTTAAPNYRPEKFNVTGLYNPTAISQNVASNLAMGRLIPSTGVSEAVKPAVEGGLWDTVVENVEGARQWYGEFTETPTGKFVEGVVGYGAGKGDVQYQAPRVRTVQAPGVASAGSFRSTPVNIQAQFADPRISNAMQKALSSEVPQIRLTLQTIAPTRGGGATVRLGSSSVSAPKIRKIKSKTKVSSD